MHYNKFGLSCKYGTSRSVSYHIICYDIGKIHCYLTSLCLQHTGDKKETVDICRLFCSCGYFFIIQSFEHLRLLEIYATVKITFVFFFIAFVYTRIFLVVRKLAQSQNKPHDGASEENLTRMKLFLREIKQAKSCFIVVICFCVLGFLPKTIAVPFFPSLDQFEKLAIKIWIITLGLCNSNVNSVIFFWTKTMLKKEAVKMLNTMRPC